MPVDEQRFDPEPVTRPEQASIPLVIDDERPHAVQFRQALRAPLAVGIQQNFAVARRPKSISEIDQLATQLHIVENFPVEHEHESAVVADHGLMAGRGEIENGQAPEPEPHGTVKE